MKNLIHLTAVVLALSALTVPAAAQREVRAATTAPGVLGFSYGWTGGITVGANGSLQMRDHPRVTSVHRGRGAAAAGLVAGDVILAVDGRDARDPAVLRDIPAGVRVEMVVRRDGRERRLYLHTSLPGAR